MALISTLQDNFNDNVRDASKWGQYASGSATVNENLERVRVVPPALTAGSNYAGYYSNSFYDLTGVAAAIQVPRVVTTSSNAEQYFSLIRDASNRLEILESNGTLFFVKRVAGVSTNIATTAYNSTTHAYWRIRESGGTTYWDTSTNGSTWTNRASQANPIVVTSLQAEFGAGTYQSEALVGEANFDNFNIDPNLTGTPVTATISTANPYASGSLKSRAGSGSWTAVASGDLYFATYSTTGATTITYSSQDPSNILRAVIDNYNESGGAVTYDGSSIDDTSTSVTYTFNTQTTLEATNKIIELSPEGWYWYVDPATNLIHLHNKSLSADHKFILGKDIELLKAEKRTENIVNTIYFNGGDTGGGSNLYKKYQNSTSVGLYGVRSLRYTDERVTVASTANTIAQKILDANSGPEIRMTLEIADSNLSTLGYDIESIQVGEVVNVRNVEGNTGSSLWDVASWDDDRWDYSIADIGTMYLQIVRKEYAPDKLTLYCSTLPPDVSKRIEDIARNLEISRTADNPTAPS